MRNPRHIRLPNSRRSQLGMTLIEIVIVIVLIGGILAVVGTSVINNSNKAKYKLTTVQVDKLGAAVESYNSDVGEYPRTLEDLSKDPEINGWLGPYADKKDLNDQWKKPFQYRVPGENGPFELISYGKDGKPGGTSVDADIISNRE
jgi:general secretion pathway protein G